MTCNQPLGEQGTMNNISANDHASVLFVSFYSSACQHSEELAQKIRRLLPREFLSAQGKEFHTALFNICQEQFLDSIYSYLVPFDNVGCILPEGYLGYSISARVSAGGFVKEIPIRNGDIDLAQMWLDVVEEMPVMSKK
jgi:hypothetical protein